MAKSRLVLDANVIRYIIFGDIDPAPLFAYARAGGSVHIADGTIVELAAALHEERLPWAKWQVKRAEIAALIDPRTPIMLGGAELLEAAGLAIERAPSRFPKPLQRYLNRRSFELFMSAPTLGQASRLEVPFIEDGHPKTIVIDMTAASKQLQTQHDKWTGFFDRLREAADQESVAVQGKVVKAETLEAQVIGLQRFLDLKTRSVPPASLRLDAQVRLHCLLSLRGIKSKQPYNAEKNRHDALDFDLCRCLALPAAICTADDRFRTKLHDAGTWQTRWVVTPDELADADRRRALMSLRWPS